MQRLIELLSDTPDTAVHSFHAISCLVRNYEPGLAAFIDIGGLECILELIQREDQEKIIIKSMFLTSSFCNEFPAVRDELIKLNAIEKITATLRPKSSFDQRLEQTLSALLSLIVTDEAIQRSQNNKINLKEKLEQIMSMGVGKEEGKVSSLNFSHIHARLSGSG